MGKTVHTREKKKLAYEMYWTDRQEVRFGLKPGKYSLNEISRTTGMDRSYISRIARGIK